MQGQLSLFRFDKCLVPPGQGLEQTLAVRGLSLSTPVGLASSLEFLQM